MEMMVSPGDRRRHLDIASARNNQCLGHGAGGNQDFILGIKGGDAGIGLRLAAHDRHQRGGAEMARLIDDLGCEIVPVTPAAARRIARAYAQWGRGIHPAALNFGDCFAYELAREHGCRLLYVGGDFAQTDIAGVL